MRNLIIKIIFCSITFLVTIANPSFAGCEDQECDNCCDKKGGIRYCDSSGGRYVCNNGDYSACYCTSHAVMDMQKFVGCCMWQGGVMKVTPKGIVVCRNGSWSEMCSTNYQGDKY